MKHSRVTHIQWLVDARSAPDTLSLPLPALKSIQVSAVAALEPNVS